MSSMRNQKTDDPQWEVFKRTILDLYIDNDMSLSEVMAAMKAQGFTKT
jgi:hypothetical protein